ncbi:UNVERIFIED_CONTAM: hypothetical protein Slati_1392800 [Sesamum latifolium]|uniref:Uncharacterized protein n=1 Tax=Sesamum latifolium TaxID=2727402 RepID=A0AAW2X515_9LAMI
MGMEVSFNGLEHRQRLLLSFLDLLFINLNVALGLINAPVLANASSIFSRNDLNMISNRLKTAHQSIAFNNAVAVGQILRVNSINTVLHALIPAAFPETDELDASHTTVSF